MQQQPITNISVPHHHLSLQGDIIGADYKHHLLLLHGAGNATSKRYANFRNSLLSLGIGSTTFDFIGHGETGGLLSESSLASRTEQASAVYKHVAKPSPLHLFGASMGAYNAIKLTELYAVSTLILFVPGIYTPEAYTVPFGPDFSEVIRREKSWELSDAWGILKNFTGDLLIVAAELDAVIPSEIPCRLYDSASQAKNRSLYTVPNAPHTLINFLNNNQNCYDDVLHRVAQAIHE